MLSVYNAVYLVSSTMIKAHLIACFVIAVLLSLITLFLIVWVDLFKKAEEEEDKLDHENKLIRNNIKGEYLKIHKIKKKHELLMKTGFLSPEQVEETIIDSDCPSLSLKKDFQGIEKEVHFDYRDDAISNKNNRGEPEGA